jgi:hypothetical protein
MRAIARIIEKLKKHPELSFKQEGNIVTVEPADADGFAVGLLERDGGCTVSFEGWHEEFESEEAALNCFAFGLSDQCRLKIDYRGSFPYRWSVEEANGDGWTLDSTTGLLLFPFWRRRHTVYRQNHVLVT